MTFSMSELEKSHKLQMEEEVGKQHVIPGHAYLYSTLIKLREFVFTFLFKPHLPEKILTRKKCMLNVGGHLKDISLTYK